MEKKNVNFEDVVYFQEGPGVRNWQFRDSGIKLINIRNLVDSELCLENTTNYLEVEEVENKYKHFLLNAGDFVMASSGVTWGKIAEVHEEHLPLCLNTSIIRLVSKDTDVLDKWYLYYYIKSPQFRRQIERLITGSAQPNFGPSHLKKVVINLPEICNQREAVEQFTKVEAVINKRQKEIELLDDLIKARFVELFGDPVTNPYNLQTATLGELSELITKGASPSWQGFSYTDDSSQTLFVTSENVREGYIDLSSPKYIEDGFNEKQKRSVIHKGDFLINIVGASIGRAAQFNLDCKANMNQAAALVRINDDRIRDKYLLIYLNSDKAQMMYNSMKSDTGRANLSLQDISNLAILLPSIDQQIEFETFANQVDKSKLIAMHIIPKGGFYIWK
ncbi:MAG: restriction endonuclease subunit S [Acetatifactor sp.]